MSKLVLNFPEGFTPSKSQIAILNSIEKSIESGQKFIICNAPTGSGKSFFAPTLAKYAGEPSNSWKSSVDDYSIFGEGGKDFAENESPFGVYALTITKSLQDQYKETFDDAAVLKGQSNYICDLDDSTTVDTAPCIYTQGLKRDCWSCNRCSYYNDRNAMLKSAFATLNYSMFFSLPEHLRYRKFLVLDEASELEEQLVSQFTCELDYAFLKKTNIKIKPFPSDEKSINVLNWLNDLKISISETVGIYSSYLKEKKHKNSEFYKKQSEYSKLQNIQSEVEQLIKYYYETQYIIEHIDNGLKFTPLKVDKLSSFLFKNADHVILLSATIIDHPNFAKTLGIDDYSYIEVPSLFDPAKSPIYILAKQKLNFSNLKSMLPTICSQIQGILEEHKDEKGIIHTHTQYIADFIRNRVNNRRLLFRETGVTNEDILKKHFSTDEPTVLVSPSMSYGVDLKGDSAKFQIVLKAPWLPTKDPRISQMMKMDSRWYSNKMICNLIQACGRGVRSEDDECVTYILDGSIYDAIAKNKKKLPKYFLDRLQ